jgi:hypothetical protein
MNTSIGKLLISSFKRRLDRHRRKCLLRLYAKIAMTQSLDSLIVRQLLSEIRLPSYSYLASTYHKITCFKTFP